MQEETRQRLADVTAQIDALVQSAPPEERFFPEFLRRLTGGIGGLGALVWSRGPTGAPELAYGLHLAALGVQDEREAVRLNLPVVREVQATGQAALFGPGERTEPAPPPGCLLAAAPLQRGGESLGVVEVFLPPTAPAGDRGAALQFVEEMCAYASRYLLRRSEAAAEPTPAETWQGVQRLSLDLQRNLRLDEVAATAANDGRQFVRSERAAVALRRHGATRLLAISGQGTVNHKANLVRLLEVLADRVLATGEPFVYTGRVETLAPQLAEPLADYLAASGSRFVMIQPLFVPTEKRSPEAGESPPGRAPRREVLGAWIVEQMTESHPRPGLSLRAQMAAPVIAAALANALAFQTIFLLPLWRFLGETWDAIRARWVWRLAAGGALAAGVAAGLFLVEREYEVEGTGQLLPAVRQQVFAPVDGQVAEIFVETGVRVAEGDPLVRLTNPDLETQLTTTRNEFNERQQQLKSLEAELNEVSSSGTREDGVRVQGKMLQTRIELQGLAARIKLLQQQVEQLVVRAPRDGSVTTFQLAQLLQDRPLKRGEAVLELMDVTGPWRLELSIPDRRFGHLLRAPRTDAPLGLPVEFVLATDPTTRYAGTVSQTATRTTTADGDNVVEVAAGIKPADLERLRRSPAAIAESAGQLRIGTETRARIACGPRSLAYWIFGEAWEYLQTRFWF